MIRRPPRSTLSSSSAASDVYKRQPDTLQAMTAVRNGEIIPGGIANGITGTLLMVVVASVIAIPISLIIGIFLYENQGKRYANLIRSLTDIPVSYTHLTLPTKRIV